MVSVDRQFSFSNYTVMTEYDELFHELDFDLSQFAKFYFHVIITMQKIFASFFNHTLLILFAGKPCRQSYLLVIYFATIFFASNLLCY